MRPDTLEVNSRGVIRVGGIDVVQLAEEYGTPLYVLDYRTLRRYARQYRDMLAELSPPGVACYAGKAHLSVALAGFLQHEGLGLDVVSGGELYTALTAGFNPGRIVFHGNLKTEDEIRAGLEARVGYFVVDSLDELQLLGQLARARGVSQRVLLRLTPGIEAHTHEFIRTGQFDSKFGFGVAEGIADRAVAAALATAGVSLAGFHAHIGSQILEEDPFLANAEVLLTYSRHWQRARGWWPEVLDLGGGFGVRYQPEDDPPALERIMAGLRRQLRVGTPAGVAPPQIFLEPGRSIVAEAGITIYTVGATKTVPGDKRYVAVDGGMGDNIRPALYQARYQAIVDGKDPDGPREIVTVAGRYCESGDILVRDVELPPMVAGDRLVVLGTGAYNYAMASNYNRVPRPPVVVVKDGEARVWVQRESWADLTRLDRPFHPFAD
ncbi:MAG: diaminopimelate decarboxylase [Thermaerobacter sp.]|nr:diaminopimelate decarboxylase [Thermaerobacter sp.]